MIRSPKLGLDPVEIVDEEAAFKGVEIRATAYRCSAPALILAGPLSARLFRNLAATVLIIADPDIDGAETTEIISRAASVGVSSYVVSQEYTEPGCWLEYSELDGLLMARVSTERRRDTYERAKRFFDVLAASFVLLMASPAMLITALLVKSGSRGPAFFKQQRVGHNGRKFWMYKFRSMHLHSEMYAFSPKTGDDSRITRIGRFLRRTCLDELPQLWNVIRGEMSLVGPRPEMPFIADRYTAFQRQRLAVKPGLTGLWQLSGDRNYSIHENSEYDLYYIDDCLEGLMRLMASAYREPLNLGTDELVSVDELVNLVCTIAGKTLVKHHDITKPQGVRGRNSDNSRLRAVLGWEPQTRLRDGLEVTYHWIENELRKTGRLVYDMAYAAD
jgi:lipopolysaccharide/colanic/teichoic acid biosynthesis glycosyltransferase